MCQFCVGKSLMTQAVCDALLGVFSTVGDPSKVISENGSNLNSQLTQKLLRPQGCSPVFDTPEHPQADRSNKIHKDVVVYRRLSRGPLAMLKES